MKNVILAIVLICLCASCYPVRYSVGKGAQGKEYVKEKNHYLIGGLAPLNSNNPAEMARGAKDYDVEIVHTFGDRLIGFITMGLYTPTTIIVWK